MLRTREQVIEKLRKARPVERQTPDYGPDYRRVNSTLKVELRAVRRSRDFSRLDVACENGTLDSIARLANDAVARSNATSVRGINMATQGAVFAVERDSARLQGIVKRDAYMAVRFHRADGCAAQGADGKWHEHAMLRPMGRDAHKAMATHINGTVAWHASRSEDQTGWEERSPEDAARDAAASALGDVEQRCDALFADLVVYAGRARSRDLSDLAATVAASRRILGDKLHACVNAMMRASAQRGKLAAALRKAGVDVRDAYNHDAR